MNALNQAREFNKSVRYRTHRHNSMDHKGAWSPIQKDLGADQIYVWQQADDLQPFDGKQFAGALRIMIAQG